MMNPGQEKFFDFILERVQDGQQAKAKALLEDNFKKQAEGTFKREDMFATQTALMKLVKPEFMEELKAAMGHFASQTQ
jgi:hypothetical protein